MRLALAASACYTPLRCIEAPLLLIEDGVIALVAERGMVDPPRNTKMLEFPGAVIAPGFLDTHVHGGAGHDVMSADPAGLAAFESYLAHHGVTSYLPTTLTAPEHDIFAALDFLAAAIESSRAGEFRARPIGIHLEGPFLSHEKRGVHPSEYLKDASIELLGRFWDAARGHIKILTVAPELPSAGELIAEAVSRGVCVSLGHSNASYETARAGITAGARRATHIFNAMRSLDHRDPGIVAAVLNDSAVSAEIIADGVHVAPAMIELLLRAKGRDAVILVTDALSAAGMGDGRYRLGTFEVQVRGQSCFSSEGRLAGSVLTLDQAVRNVTTFAGWSLQDAIRLATINPARDLQLPSSQSLLSPGAPADLVILTPAGEVIQTFVRGIAVS